GKIAAVRVVYAGESACLPLLGVYVDRFNGKDCATLAKRTVALAATQHPAAIVLVARWTVYVGGKTRPNERKQIYRIDDEGNIDKLVHGIEAFRYALDKTLATYEALGVPVILMEDNPQQ